MAAYPVYNRTSSSRALISVLRGAVTVSGDTIDRGGDNVSVLFVVLTGTLTDGTQTFTIEDSDDGSSWGAAAAAGVQPSTAVATVATDDDAVKEISYQGPKRYCRIKIVGTGATGGISGAVAIKYGGRKPVMR